MSWVWWMYNTGEFSNQFNVFFHKLFPPSFRREVKIISILCYRRKIRLPFLGHLFKQLRPHSLLHLLSSLYLYPCNDLKLFTFFYSRPYFGGDQETYIMIGTLGRGVSTDDPNIRLFCGNGERTLTGFRHRMT